jgi:hypothetical protein
MANGDQELARLANATALEIDDYARLATAVFGNALAQEDAKAALWKQREARMITFGAYEYGRKQIEDTSAVDACWRRLRQDLYEGRRSAYVGVQIAFDAARRSGVLNDPRWGGERKREVRRPGRWPRPCGSCCPGRACRPRSSRARSPWWDASAFRDASRWRSRCSSCRPP